MNTHQYERGFLISNREYGSLDTKFNNWAKYNLSPEIS